MRGYRGHHYMELGTQYARVVIVIHAASVVQTGVRNSCYQLRFPAFGDRAVIVRQEKLSTLRIPRGCFPSPRIVANQAALLVMSAAR
jgi:hypothetical protein